ncbi:hypothetical protein GQ43DRAFT_408864 [Delitschia confertaspora ATCC 74209]|uniref:Uncharacterized protein n=1 Tax=Delitschia confertaspora ATCC 74209 TaxID=1513339 RepID=A0A9P4JYC6_9PLEO|nr:hypothetical protein GQ43DRAFT_408864 [Delitschia confertaspora ATCC 74209]
MATTRLRQTFRYPDSDSENENEGMDEQEQETLLSSLATQDTRTTTVYTHLLLVLPLLPVFFYIPLLGHAPTLLPSVLGITSLLATAYILYYIPLPAISTDTTPTPSKPISKRKGKANMGKAPEHKTSSETNLFTPRSPLSTLLPHEQIDLLHQYLVPVNAALCLLSALYQFTQGGDWVSGVQIGGGYMPGLILGVILVARRELRVVDLSELERMRYRYKGV